MNKFFVAGISALALFAASDVMAGGKGAGVPFCNGNDRGGNACQGGGVLGQEDNKRPTPAVPFCNGNGRGGNACQGGGVLGQGDNKRPAPGGIWGQGDYKRSASGGIWGRR